MKPHFFSSSFRLAVIFCALLTVTGFSKNTFGGNTISGFIFDRSGVPLSDIDVELLDEYYRLALSGTARMKTDSSGRYQFTGLNDGNYNLKVYAFRYDLQDAQQYIEVKSVSAIPGSAGSGYYSQDFYLQPRKGGIKELELGVIFAEKVPKDAENAYKEALEHFKNKRSEQAMVSLGRAINLYPEYFAALIRFGAELLRQKRYLEAAPVYLKAGTVNQKAAVAFYYLGFAFYKAGQKYNKSAHTALLEALRLAPGNVPVLVLTATVERQMGDLVEAEKHLLLAKKTAANKDPNVQMALAELYNDLKRYKDAADELDGYLKSIKLSDEETARTKKLIAELRQKAVEKAPGTIN